MSILNTPKKPVLWIYGLSGAGKSTLALALCEALSSHGIAIYHLDGDVLRSGLNKDLGFSAEDRRENLRRAAEVAKLMQSTGLAVVASFITPLEKDRDLLSDILGESLIKVCLTTPLVVCEQRDPKGLYAKARKGIIPEFTGISAPFEFADNNSDLLIDTSLISSEEAVQMLLKLYEL